MPRAAHGRLSVCDRNQQARERMPSPRQGASAINWITASDLANVDVLSPRLHRNDLEAGLFRAMRRQPANKVPPIFVDCSPSRSRTAALRSRLASAAGRFRVLARTAACQGFPLSKRAAVAGRPAGAFPHHRAMVKVFRPPRGGPTWARASSRASANRPTFMLGVVIGT